MSVDGEIVAVEQRIARERNALGLLAEDWAGAARDALVSKTSLLAVAAVGFVLGDALRPARRAGGVRKARLGGMLAGLAYKVVAARYGSPWALAELAWRGWRSTRAAPPPPVPFPVRSGPPPQ